MGASNEQIGKLKLITLGSDMIDFVTRRSLGGAALVSVQGRLDESSREYFFECLKDLFDDGVRQIIVDCEGLGAVSSSGLAALLKTRRQAQKSGGKIVLTNVNSLMMEILTHTRLNTLLDVYPTTEHLLAKLRLQSQAKEVKSACHHLQAVPSLETSPVGHCESYPGANC
jgi:anti-anti-sigma factor